MNKREHPGLVVAREQKVVDAARELVLEKRHEDNEQYIEVFINPCILNAYREAVELLAKRMLVILEQDGFPSTEEVYIGVASWRISNTQIGSGEYYLHEDATFTEITTLRRFSVNQATLDQLKTLKRDLTAWLLG